MIALMIEKQVIFKVRAKSTKFFHLNKKCWFVVAAVNVYFTDLFENQAWNGSEESI